MQTKINMTLEAIRKAKCDTKKREQGLEPFQCWTKPKHKPTLKAVSERLECPRFKDKLMILLGEEL